MVQPFSHIEEKIELYQINTYIFSSNAALLTLNFPKLHMTVPVFEFQGTTSNMNFFTCEFNEQRWKHQHTKMYKGPSRSIVRISLNFFIYILMELSGHLNKTVKNTNAKLV